MAGAWSHDTQSRCAAAARHALLGAGAHPLQGEPAAGAHGQLHVLDVKNGRINKIHQVLSREQTAELLRIFERETDAARARDRYCSRIRMHFLKNRRVDFLAQYPKAARTAAYAALPLPLVMART